MLHRKSILAGRWYDANAHRLQAQVEDFLANGASRLQVKPEVRAGKVWGLMLPHAGHVYCGNVLGATLQGVDLPADCVIICPNHTGQGQPFGVWPDGVWHTPLGALNVNAELAAQFIARPPFAADVQSHAGEHSIEIILPFLQAYAGTKAPSIVPVCVGTQNFAALEQAGKALAEVMSFWAQQGREVGVIVSSDMNHFDDVPTTLKKDQLALEKAIAAEPRAFLETVQRNDISMCGAGPMALALTAMHQLGTPTAEFVCHDTSATASGDSQRVVGYAGLRLFVA